MTLDELAATAGADAEAAPAAPAPPAAQDVAQRIWDIVRRPTGRGALEEYADHPAALGATRSWWRVARGIEGLTSGGAGLALVDLGLGLLGVFRGWA